MTTKPDLTRIWASGADPSNIIDPDVGESGKFANGWEAELPPFEYFNFLFKLFTEAFASFNENGIPTWDSNTVYAIGALSKGSNNLIYQAVQSQSGNDPISDTGNNWKLYTDIIALSVLQKEYPVDSIYITTKSGNPSTWLGFGTWTAFAAGRVLVGVDGTQTEFDAVSKTGGAKTHQLTISEMPAHTHALPADAAGSSNIQSISHTSNSDEGITESNVTGSRGGNSAHNNLQPYIAVFIWKRTA